MTTVLQGDTALRPEAIPGRTPEMIVLEGLRSAAADLRALGVPVPEPAGKLLRPLVAWALVPPESRPSLDGRFWSGALAVQMVHEASLLHDDILDGAACRRGTPTLAASAGVGPALVMGDHYLTGAYRAAARVDATAYLIYFVEAVERTVAGEIEQGRSTGARLSSERSMEIVTGKSGELFGAAAVLGSTVLPLGNLEERQAFGRALGALYQRVDDLLDYCPAAETGKPPFLDYRQRKWTWVLDLAGVEGFGAPEEEVVQRLFLGRDGRTSAAWRAVARLQEERKALLRRLVALSPGDQVVRGVLDAWIRTAVAGVGAQEDALGAAPGMVAGFAEVDSRRGSTRRVALSAEEEVARLARDVGGPEAWGALFARHARTFRFAARLFPAEPARRVAGLYAYCRFTDDLVDEPDLGRLGVTEEASPEDRTRRLDAWRALTRAAFEGHATDVPLLDEVVATSAREGVSWRYPDALLAGVGTDLSPEPYPDWARLETYTFGVAGAVGGWMCQLLGFRDPVLLSCAHALGHAMQLTNILRDVGEDLAVGRVYLPGVLLDAYGLSAEELDPLRHGPRPLILAYKDAMDELMARADGWYARAWPGIRRLPPWFARPVAVAAEAYRGIHQEVRRNGYDNLLLRAHTSRFRKVVLGAAGLARARA